MISYKDYLNKVGYESREYARFRSDILSDGELASYEFHYKASNYDYRIIGKYLKDKKAKPEVLALFYDTFIDYILDCNSYTLTQERQDALIKELEELKNKAEDK